MSSKTKEEVINEVVPRNCFWEDNLDNVPLHYIHTAMDSFAKERSISFAEWIVDSGWGMYNKAANVWINEASDFMPTTSDLYDIFLIQSI